VLCVSLTLSPALQYAARSRAVAEGGWLSHLTDLTEGARLDQFWQLNRYHAESLVPGAKVDLDLKPSLASLHLNP
jgi:hypothetical protein